MSRVLEILSHNDKRRWSMADDIPLNDSWAAVNPDDHFISTGLNSDLTKIILNVQDGRTEREPGALVFLDKNATDRLIAQLVAARAELRW